MNYEKSLIGILIFIIACGLAAACGCKGGEQLHVELRRPAEIWIDEADGPQPMTEQEFADFIATVKLNKISPVATPDPISAPIAAPAPIPHASCRCKTCDCTPACVGACSIPQPAEDAPAPIANSTPAASAAPATSGSASSCPGGQCSIRSAPVRRGLFGWRR